MSAVVWPAGRLPYPLVFCFPRLKERTALKRVVVTVIKLIVSSFSNVKKLQ